MVNRVIIQTFITPRLETETDTQVVRLTSEATEEETAKEMPLDDQASETPH